MLALCASLLVCCFKSDSPPGYISRACNTFRILCYSTFCYSFVLEQLQEHALVDILQVVTPYIVLVGIMPESLTLAHTRP
jgi:hypothetical protein